MYQRIIYALGVLLLGKEYVGGIVHNDNVEKATFVLESVFPNEEIQKLAHQAIETIASEKADRSKIAHNQA